MAQKQGSAKLQTLVRWLNLVPYFRSHEGATLFEAAADLGLDYAELKAALGALTCTGVGKHTEEMIDMLVTYKEVTIIDDQGLDKPLRLTPTEASALLLTLELLEHMPGLVDADAVRSAAAKLRAIMDDKAAAIYDSLADADPQEVAWQEQLADALRRQVQLQLTYWSHSRDATTQRVVEPTQIFVNEDDTYLRAWQPDLGEYRTFRVDRIQDVQVLDVPAGERPVDRDFDTARPFEFRHADIAQLEIHPEFTWLAEHFDITLGEVRENGMVAATIPVASEEWLVRFSLGQAGRLRVVGPDHLSAAVRAAAETAHSRYTQ